MQSSQYLTWMGIEYIGIVAFSMFSLLHILDRSRKAALFLIPGLIYLAFFVTCMTSRRAGRFWPVSRAAPFWTEPSLEWVHLLLLASFVFFVASPIIRWRAARRRKEADKALVAEEDMPA